MLRTRTTLALPLLLGLAANACKDPGRIDLLLRLSDELDLAPLGDVEVRLLSGASGSELRRATVSGANLADLPQVFSKSEIDPGSSYVFEVRAAVDTEVCASGRVVGRSLPVTVSSDTAVSSATAYVACADGITKTGQLRDARALSGAIWAPNQGGALLVGGASRVDFSDASTTATPLSSVEVYDVAQGEFSSVPDLLDARMSPGLALDAEGRVVVLGGAAQLFMDPREWLDSVEEIDGAARRGKGLLDGRWVDPRPIALSDGTLALVGVGLHLAPDVTYQASFYDPRTETIPHDAIERFPLNEIAVAFPGRGRALLAGGASGTSDPLRPVLFCDTGDCGCAEAPCLVELGEEGAPETWGAGPGWSDSAGAWLSCPEGGGTAWIVGGRITDPGQPADPDQSVGDVFCYRDTDDPSRAFERVGVLRARNGHGVVALRGNRLLVVGGAWSEAGDGVQLSHGITEAEIVRVSPCACDPIEPEAVTTVVVDPTLDEVGQYLTSRNPLLLGDGTVLVTGVARLNLVDGDPVLQAGTDAWVFNPDLPE